MSTEHQTAGQEQSQSQDIPRRQMLRWGGAVGVGGLTAGTTGCSQIAEGGSGPDLQIVDKQAETTTFGNVEAQITVTNDGSETGSGTIYVEVDIVNGDTYTNSETIRLEADQTRTYKVTVDINTLDSIANDQAQVNVWLET